MPWQPIETAPKDGTKVDLYGTRTRSDLSEARERVTDAAWRKNLPGPNRWTLNGDPIRFFKPTHWAPITTPPENAQ